MKSNPTIYIYLFFTTFLSLGQALASEVDSFHKRYVKLSDSTDALNKKSKELMQDSLDRTNARQLDRGLKCSEKILYRHMRRNFKNLYSDKFSKWIRKTDEIEKITIPIRESIFQDFRWFEAIIPGLFARIFQDPSAKLLQVGDVRLGNDKFQHFMGSGFRYFKTHYLKEKSIEKALKIGWRAETGIMGSHTTGVMSYADMVANFNGMRFWNHVLAKNIDIFGPEDQYNPGPYVKCVDGDWTLIKEMDWSNYIDHGFDEGINCSKFSSQTLTDAVQQRIFLLEEQDNRRFQCPILPKKLDELSLKYKKFHPYLINLEGHSVAPEE